MRTPEICSPSKFPVFNSVLLAMVIMLCITSLELFILHNGNLVPFTTAPYLPMSLPQVGTLSTLCFCGFNFFFRFYTEVRSFSFSFCLWLISLGIMFPRCIHIVANPKPFTIINHPARLSLLQVNWSERNLWEDLIFIYYQRVGHKSKPQMMLAFSNI